MLLFSGTTDHQSHRVRLVLAEKGVYADIKYVEPRQVPDDLKEVNPSLRLPTFVDRNLTLDNTPVIMEYLDERYPHPPLMPQLPVARAKKRQLMYDIEKSWSSLVDLVCKGKGRKSVLERAHRELRQGLIRSASSHDGLFRGSKYLIDGDYSLLDCSIAPILWRIDSMNIALPARQTRTLKAYMRLAFNRDAFQDSLTEDERDLHS